MGTYLPTYPFSLYVILKLNGRITVVLQLFLISEIPVISLILSQVLNVYREAFLNHTFRDIRKLKEGREEDIAITGRINIEDLQASVNAILTK